MLKYQEKLTDNKPRKIEASHHPTEAFETALQTPLYKAIVFTIIIKIIKIYLPWTYAINKRSQLLKRSKESTYNQPNRNETVNRTVLQIESP